MKYILLSLLSIAVVGCALVDKTYTVKQFSGEVSLPSLVDATSPTHHPDKGTQYMYVDNGSLITRGLYSYRDKKGNEHTDGLLVENKDQKYVRYYRNGIYRESFLRILLETPDEYVENESLRSGRYEYIGIKHGYRKFKKVSEAPKE